MRYRICYKDAAGEGRYRDIATNNLGHAIWMLAIELDSAATMLVDTLILPSKENSHQVPAHVELYPDWTAELCRPQPATTATDAASPSDTPGSAQSASRRRKTYRRRSTRRNGGSDVQMLALRRSLLDPIRLPRPHAQNTRDKMRTYTCDGCKKPLEPPVYMHTLAVLYSADGTNTRELHFHWECLKKYVKEA